MRTGSLRPIETRYKGYRFRSRLEARWAVFFDHLYVDWEYEPEGFVLPDGTRYLPDFLVRAHAESRWGLTGHTQCWVEIKPTRPSKAEYKKLSDLYFYSDHETTMAVFCIGMPGENVMLPGIYIGPDALARAEQTLHGREALRHSSPVGHCMRTEPSYRRIMEAVSAARGARFEYGEAS